MVSLKLAILGTRGVPPNYGGFETFAAELSTRLVKRGHEVSVYCRDGVPRRPVPRGSSVPRSSSGGEGAHPEEPRGTPRNPEELVPEELVPEELVWNGVQRIVLPAAGHKYLETVSHAFLSALDALRRDFDAVLVCNAANAFVLPLLKAARIPVAINVDGIERKRRKWNVLGRAVYAAGEAMSVSFANAVVADAEVIASYYREHYAASPVVIPYGAEFPDEEDSDVLGRLGIRPGEYILYVSRFEPENNPLEVVLAYERAMGQIGPMGLMGPIGQMESAIPNPQSSILNPQSPISPAALGPRPSALPPLVMLGKGLYAKDLVEDLHTHASNQIRFPGALYDRDYRTLQRNALLYIQATEVGGTHPALIEAMASGGRVLAHDTPENREVGGDAVGYFQLRPAETLSGMLREWLSAPQTREDYRLRARRRAAGLYSWGKVTDAYESLFEALAGAR